jgi:hypothetical protein
MLTRKIAEYCQSQPYPLSNGSIEQILEGITVQRCYDPFSLLEALVSGVPSLPLQMQPDVLVIMDWTKASLPFMTAKDLFQHRRQFSSDSSHLKEGRGKGKDRWGMRHTYSDISFVLVVSVLHSPS